MVGTDPNYVSALLEEISALRESQAAHYRRGWRDAMKQAAGHVRRPGYPDSAETAAELLFTAPDGDVTPTEELENRAIIARWHEEDWPLTRAREARELTLALRDGDNRAAFEAGSFGHQPKPAESTNDLVSKNAAAEIFAVLQKTDASDRLLITLDGSTITMTAKLPVQIASIQISTTRPKLVRARNHKAQMLRGRRWSSSTSKG